MYLSILCTPCTRQCWKCHKISCKNLLLLLNYISSGCSMRSLWMNKLHSFLHEWNILGDFLWPIADNRITISQIYNTIRMTLHFTVMMRYHLFVLEAILSQEEYSANWRSTYPWEASLLFITILWLIDWQIIFFFSFWSLNQEGITGKQQ